MSEHEGPTAQDVYAAVLALPDADLRELAKGPIESDDPDACRICELYDAYVYGRGPDVPHHMAILTIIDYHRFYGSPARDGRGPEAFRRCEEVYEIARKWAA